MSAIAKPFIKFTSSLDNTILIPVEAVKSMDKIDIPALDNPSTPAQIGILFTMLNPLALEIKVLWADSADRDTDFTAAETLLATPVA